MGIYIDMEMPKEYGRCMVIFPDGRVTTEFGSQVIARAISVPPHRELVELSKVLDIVCDWCPDDDGSVGKKGDLREMLDEIEALPTITPADKEK